MYTNSRSNINVQIIIQYIILADVDAVSFVVADGIANRLSECPAGAKIQGFLHTTLDTQIRIQNKGNQWVNNKI